MAIARAARPIAVRVALCLALGAITAVLVAWAAAALRPSDSWPNALRTPADLWHEEYFMPQHRQRTSWGDVYVDVDGCAVKTEVRLTPGWLVVKKGDWWDTTYPYPENVPDWARRQHVPLTFELPAWAAKPDGSSTERGLCTTAWGWPALCLCGVERQFAGFNPVKPGSSSLHWMEGYWVLDDSGTGASRVRRLPLRPIWRGMLIDSGLFSACWFAILLGPGSARNWMRRRRGRCPRCGYDLRSTPAGSPCPECGPARHP